MDWDHFSDQEVQGFLANYPHLDTPKIICIGGTAADNQASGKFALQDICEECILKEEIESRDLSVNCKY